MTSDKVCVAHLVRGSNGIAPFENFLRSYRRNAAGLPHELLIIFKGFSKQDELAAYDALLEGVSHKRMFTRDVGYDVRPYMRAAREHSYQYFLFLNSFSEVLAPGWLEMLYRQAVRPGVGLVGATASHQSIASDYDLFKWEIRKTLPAYKRALMPLHRYLRYMVTIRNRFPPFPNYHVRTNAFMIAREVMNRLRTQFVLHKWDAYRFESGIGGMTYQIMAAGLTPLIVGANDHAYQPSEWPNARTFWISNQENLLISDNQTRAYQQGSPVLRERLAFHAWRRSPEGALRSDVPPLPDNVRAVSRCPQCKTLSALLFQARDVNRAVTEETFAYYRCGQCGLVFLQPIPHDLRHYYPAGYHAKPESEDNLLERAEKEQFKLDAIGNVGHGRSLLEIGPSYGHFAALAKRVGFKVEAIEMDGECCTFLQNALGIQAFHTENVLATLKRLGRFDVIALWHAIEHLPDPWALLDAIPEHLRPGGLLAIASPNPRSLQFRLLGRGWVHLDAPRHVNLIPYQLLEARLAGRQMRRVHVSTSDQGALDCNLLGWVSSLQRVLPSWMQARPFMSGAWRIISNVMRFEQRGSSYGAAYTIVFQKN